MRCPFFLLVLRLYRFCFILLYCSVVFCFFVLRSIDNLFCHVVCADANRVEQNSVCMVFSKE